MTAKEKAKLLFYKMYDWQLGSIKFNTPTVAKEIAKQCALIACEEVLGYMGADRGTEFWAEVKKEIEKL